MASLGAVDLLPPSAIGDLALSVDVEEEEGALEVAFTAPGDDGDGGGAGEFDFLVDWFRFIAVKDHNLRLATDSCPLRYR